MFALTFTLLPFLLVASAAPAKRQDDLSQFHRIRYDGSSKGCVQVGGGSAAVSSPMFIGGCGHYFDLKRNVPGPIKLWSGSAYTTLDNLCIEAVDGGWTDGGRVEAKPCDGSPNQQWYYTDDNHIAYLGGNQCLDVKADSTPTFNRPGGTQQNLQTWQCVGESTQQAFTEGEQAQVFN